MINNSEFLLKEIPNFHPIAERYEALEWWKEQKRRCIEGYWVGGKWCPGELYYYINFHNIKFETDEGTSTAMGLPSLRDIEWEKAYIYSEATGFSGFVNDTEYTCDRKYGPEKEKNLKYGWITQEQLDRFKYLDVREYLARPYTTDLGKPIYKNESKNVMDLEGRGGGKELIHSELIATPTGFTTMGKIQIGDFTIGKDGKPVKVLQKTYCGLKDIYELTLHDGRSVRCGLEHQWEVFDGKNKRVIETKDLLNIGLIYTHTKNGGESYRFKIENCKPIEYQEKELIVDPYILGCLLGDGSMTKSTPKIASSDEFILEEFRRILGNHYELKHDTSTTNNYTIVYNYKSKEIKTKGWYNPLYNNIQTLGINKSCSEKFIPEIYKFGSIEQRLSLLQGMLDTDGSINFKGSIEFTNTNERLVDDLIEVARSLGIQCRKGVDDRSEQLHTIKEHECYRSITYRAYLRTDLPVFRLPRKKDKIQSMKRKNWVSIVDIKKLDYQEECSCIYVDSEDHTYLTRDYVVTHNSYWASACIAHNFLFDGARDYDEYIRRKRENIPYVSDTVVGAIDAKYSNDLLSKVKLGVENLPGKSSIISVLGETEYYPSPLYTSFTGSLMAGKSWTNTQGSVLNHRTFADNPLAANGTRPNRVFLEEVGFMNNIIESWGAIEATQAAAEGKRLTIYGLGTGGLTTGGAALYTQEIFYHPEAYNCLSFPDQWEDRGAGRKIGYFLPAEKTRNKFKEGENKITNVEKARESIREEIENAKNSGSRVAYLSKVINNPRVPSDIFLRAEGVFFPIHELKECLAELERNTLLLSASYKVDLRLIEGVVSMYPSDKKPITEFPLTKGSTMDACVEIFEKPKKDAGGIVIPNRYYLSCDPVDDDGNSDVKRSLQSVHVMDMWTDRIVAEYSARTYLAEDFYETTRKLCLFYRGRLLYENNKKGLYGHFKNKNSLHLLLETPQILKDQELVKFVGIGNRALGVNMTDAIKYLGINLTLSWLEKPSYGNPEKKNMTTIRSVALLKELVAFALDVNADRVSSLLIMMILKQELGERATERAKTQTKSTNKDPFWGRAYSDFHSQNVYNQLKNLRESSSN